MIDFSYFPEGLKLGGLISGGSIVILIFLWFLRREMDRRKARERMLRLRKIQREFDEEPDSEEFNPSKADSSRQTLDDVQTAEILNIDNKDLPNTINNRKETTEEEP